MYFPPSLHWRWGRSGKLFHRPPHSKPIDREHAGTADDPIPWVYGMDCHAGKCYRYNGKVYQVAEGGDMIPCTWPPDTPGMWQWEEVQA